MARPDVLIQKQNSFEEIQTRLNELERDDQRKLVLDSVESTVEVTKVVDVKQKVSTMKPVTVDVQVEDEHEFDI